MKPIFIAIALGSVAPCAMAQQKAAAEGIAEYRKMLENSNPAELFEAKGENLCKKMRGPKNASLERFGLSTGPGPVLNLPKLVGMQGNPGLA